MDASDRRKEQKRVLIEDVPYPLSPTPLFPLSLSPYPLCLRLSNALFLMTGVSKLLFNFSSHSVHSLSKYGNIIPFKDTCSFLKTDTTDKVIKLIF